MPSRLVKHYISQNPEESARVLESLSADALCSFFAELDPVLSARLITHLLPTAAARCLGTLQIGQAAELLVRLPHASAARLLSQVDSTAQRALLAALPQAKRQTLRHALRYPDDSVGAIMLVETPSCRGSANVRLVKRLIRRLPAGHIPVLTVLDVEGRPIGIVGISELLRLREKEPISDHMRAVPARLRVRAPIETVLNLRAWAAEDYLPVIDGDGKLVGMLAKTAVYQYVLQRDLTRRRQGELTSTVVALAELMWRPSAEVLVNATSRRTGD